MPYVISWNKKEVYCKFTGELTGQELIDCNMAMYGNPNFDVVHMQIFDMSEVTQIAFAADDVMKVAAFDRAAAKMNPRMKCALVSTDQVAQRLSKIYQNEIRSSPWEGKSFQTLKKACEWASQVNPYPTS